MLVLGQASGFEAKQTSEMLSWGQWETSTNVGRL